MKKASEGQIIHQIHTIKARHLTYAKQGIQSDWYVRAMQPYTKHREQCFPQKPCIHTILLP